MAKSTIRKGQKAHVKPLVVPAHLWVTAAHGGLQRNERKREAAFEALTFVGYGNDYASYADDSYGRVRQRWP